MSTSFQVVSCLGIKGKNLVSCLGSPLNGDCLVAVSYIHVYSCAYIIRHVFSELFWWTNHIDIYEVLFLSMFGLVVLISRCKTNQSIEIWLLWVEWIY